MEALGERLSSAREKKGYSLDQVARDTNIARKYLTALEEEDFSQFPGDPYLIGFLKNYADYLGLDVEDTVALYRNLKLQEQPAPIEELLDKGRSGVPVFLAVVIIAVILGAGGYFGYRYLSRPDRMNAAAVPEPEETVETVETPAAEFYFDISVDGFEERFKESSFIEITNNGESYNLSLSAVGRSAEISYSGGSVSFALGDRRELDMDSDGNSDIILEVKDIDASGNAAVLAVEKFGGDTDAVEIESSGNQDTGSIPEPGSSNVASRNQKTSVIMENTSPEPFMLDVIFRDYCLVRYVADGGNRTEQYFDKGETFRLNVDREIMLWLSNAGSFRAKIAGEEVSFGGSGEVSTYLVKWNRNSGSGNYELQKIPVY